MTDGGAPDGSEIETHDDLSALADRIGLPDAEAVVAAERRRSGLLVPPGALGRLESLAGWLCGAQGTCPPRPLQRVRVVVFAGDHGVARTAGTSAYPPEVTVQLVSSILAGRAAVNVLARANGATVRVVDMSVDTDYGELAADLPPLVVRDKVRRSSGSIDREDAMTRSEAEDCFAAGVRIAEEEVDAGADLLVPGDVGIGSTTPAAVLVGLLARVEPALAVGRSTGIDDATWMRKTAAVRDAMRRGRPVLGDPIGLLATVGGPALAAMTGFLLGAAARRTPVLLDGVVSGAAALLAHRIAFRSLHWWLAGHRSTEPAHAAALSRLALEPIVDYGLRLGAGTGALVALPVLRAAGDLLRETATREQAGGSDRSHRDQDDADPDVTNITAEGRGGA